MNNSWFGVVIMVVSCWICAGSFLGFGLFARRYKKPVWFWSGSTIDPQSIIDIPAYNRANFRMWALFSIPFWISGLLSIWWMMAAAILLVAACVLGLPVLIFTYTRIFRKYRVNDYE